MAASPANTADLCRCRGHGDCRCQEHNPRAWRSAHGESSTLPKRVGGDLCFDGEDPEKKKKKEIPPETPCSIGLNSQVESAHQGRPTTESRWHHETGPRGAGELVRGLRGRGSHMRSGGGAGVAGIPRPRDLSSTPPGRSWVEHSRRLVERAGEPETPTLRVDQQPPIRNLTRSSTDANPSGSNTRPVAALST
jgi:hypothetical protein